VRVARLPGEVFVTWINLDPSDKKISELPSVLVPSGLSLEANAMRDPSCEIAGVTARLAAICRNAAVCFQVGAGIVADSVPEAEYEETLVKARGFFAALYLQSQSACAILTT